MVPITSLSERLMRGPSGNFPGLHAFVAGATGGTGRAIVARLSAEGIPVRALVRDIGAAVRSTFCTPHQSRYSKRPVPVRQLTYSRDMHDYSSLPPAYQPCAAVSVSCKWYGPARCSSTSRP